MNTGNQPGPLVWIAAMVFIALGGVCIYVVIEWSSLVAKAPSPREAISTGTSIAIFSLILTSLTISVGISAIVPYFISSHKIKSEVNNAIIDKYKDYDSSMDKIERANLKTDAHLSRMIGYDLNKDMVYTWSIGWCCRSLKRYLSIPSINPLYGEFFHEVSDIIYSNIYSIIKDVDEEQYDKDEILKNIYKNIMFYSTGDERVSVRACKDLIDLNLIIQRSSKDSNIQYLAGEKLSESSQIFLFLSLSSILSNNSRYSHITNIPKLSNDIEDISSSKGTRLFTASLIKGEIWRPAGNQKKYSEDVTRALKDLKILLRSDVPQK